MATTIFNSYRHVSHRYHLNSLQEEVPRNPQVTVIGVANGGSSSDEESDLEPPLYSPISVSTEGGTCSSSDESSDEGSDGSHGEQATVIFQEGHEGEAEEEGKKEATSYKIVGDNIDKNVKPSLQRAEIQSQSLHYFHSFAVRDRVPVSGLSDAQPKVTTPDPKKFLLTPEDIRCIKEEMNILLSR